MADDDVLDACRHRRARRAPRRATQRYAAKAAVVCGDEIGVARGYDSLQALDAALAPEPLCELLCLLVGALRRLRRLRARERTSEPQRRQPCDLPHGFFSTVCSVRDCMWRRAAFASSLGVPGAAIPSIASAVPSARAPSRVPPARSCHATVP